MMAKILRPISSVLLLFALTLGEASCDGFFVDPTLTSVSVGPQNVSIKVNEQWKMSATGTYNDGSQKTLSSVVWSSSDSAVASVDQMSGQVTGLSIGSATIYASSGSCSACTGSATVNVVLQEVSSIAVTPGEQTVQINGSPVYYTALANGSTDITNAGATWTVVDSTGFDQTLNFSLAFVEGKGEGFLPNSNVHQGTYTVRASYNGIIGTAVLNVQ